MELKTLEQCYNLFNKPLCISSLSGGDRCDVDAKQRYGDFVGNPTAQRFFFFLNKYTNTKIDWLHYLLKGITDTPPSVA